MQYLLNVDISAVVVPFVPQTQHYQYTVLAGNIGKLHTLCNITVILLLCAVFEAVHGNMYFIDTGFNQVRTAFVQQRTVGGNGRMISGVFCHGNQFRQLRMG